MRDTWKREGFTEEAELELTFQKITSNARQTRAWAGSWQALRA